jgi:MFS family permease
VPLAGAFFKVMLMTHQSDLTRSRLKTPRAAAIAGILFSILILVALLLLRFSVPAEDQILNAEPYGRARTIGLALNLVPIAGVAFLWFIGVLRDRLGQREDRLFATVFLGSGLLFLGMLFCAAAVAGVATMALTPHPQRPFNTDMFVVLHRLASDLMNVYATKMAAVFMFSTSTVAVYTDFAPRPIAILGYILALLLLFGAQYITWSFLVFPLWVLLLSAYILIDNLRPTWHTVK